VLNLNQVLLSAAAEKIAICKIGTSMEMRFAKILLYDIHACGYDIGGVRFFAADGKDTLVD
jgi:hypothetical protein